MDDIVQEAKPLEFYYYKYNLSLNTLDLMIFKNIFVKSIPRQHVHGNDSF